MLIIVAFLMAAVSILFMTSESRLAFAAGRPEENQQRMLPAGRYEKLGSAEVKGRQGICTDGEYCWVSGSASLAKYDHDWNLIAENEDPFKGYEIEVNHIGDIDVLRENFISVQSISRMVRGRISRLPSMTQIHWN